jgi:integrase
LLVYTPQRIAEVVGATWDEFDLKAGTCTIPRERMKRKDVERTARGSLAAGATRCLARMAHRGRRPGDHGVARATES